MQCFMFWLIKTMARWCCQAQPKIQLQLAEFSFIFSFSSPTPTPTWASSEIAGNEKNLLFNNGRSTLIEYKSILKLLKKWKTTFMEDTSVEDNLSGRRPPWKIASVVNDLSGRRPQWKMTSVEDDLIGRRPHWKTISVEDNLSGRRSQWKSTSVEEDLISLESAKYW